MNELVLSGQTTSSTGNTTNFKYEKQRVIRTTGKSKAIDELSFTKYFYKPATLRPLTENKSDIQFIEKETDGLLNQILGI